MSFARTPSGSVLTPLGLQHQNSASMRFKKSLWQVAIGGAVVAIAGALRGRLHLQFIYSIPFFARDPVLRSHQNFLIASVVGWVIFSAYWEIAAKDSTVAQSSESHVSRGFHVFLTNLALVVEIVPIHGLGRFLPDSYFIMGTGLAVEAMGLFLTIWARRHLGQNWSGRISVMAEHELIRSGPYRRLRHPIYTGLLAMYVGVALVTGEWLAVVGVAIAVFAYWRKIRIEEATLDTAFGADYESYRRTTWALVPGLY